LALLDLRVEHLAAVTEGRGSAFQVLRGESVLVDDRLDAPMLTLGDPFEKRPRLIVILLGDAELPDLRTVRLRVMADVIEVAKQHAHRPNRAMAFS
jgi:hypothetical protein